MHACMHADLEEGLGKEKGTAPEQEAPRPRRWNQPLVVLVACCVIAGVLVSSVITTAVNATYQGAWWRVTAKLCVSGGSQQLQQGTSVPICCAARAPRVHMLLHTHDRLANVQCCLTRHSHYLV
jgi:hypothetical protein